MWLSHSLPGLLAIIDKVMSKEELMLREKVEYVIGYDKEYGEYYCVLTRFDSNPSRAWESHL